MPRRERRLKEQHWVANRQAAVDRQRTQHAQGLAHLAGIVADVHGSPVQGQGLIVSRLAGPGGVIVWHPEQGRPLLHVLQAARVIYYEAGDWEQRLVSLAQEVTPCPP